MKRWAAALLVSLAASSAMLNLGLVIGLFGLLGLLADERDLSAIGIILLVSAFPAAMFAAHCLDRAYEARNAFRAEAIELTYEHCS